MLSKLISNLKNEEYKVTYKFSFLETFYIIFFQGSRLVRGVYKVKFKAQTKGLVFAQKGAKLVFSKKFKCGRNLIIGRYSYINALSLNGVDIGDNFSMGHYSIIKCTGVLRAVGERLVIGNNVGINHIIVS